MLNGTHVSVVPYENNSMNTFHEFCRLWKAEKKWPLERGQGFLWYHCRATGDATADIQTILRYYDAASMPRPEANDLERSLRKEVAGCIVVVGDRFRLTQEFGTTFDKIAGAAFDGKRPVFIVGSSEIFLSYRRRDSSQTADDIRECLSKSFGKSAVFLDVQSIPLGVDFRKHIEDEVSRAAIFLAIIGPHWAGGDATRRRIDDASDFVRIEVAAALDRGIPVIPVLVDGASMPRDKELPEPLADLAFRQAIEVRPEPHFLDDVGRLITGIQRHYSKC